MTAGTQRINIKLKGGGPWGFRLQGGPGTGLPLTVSKVRRKSKAYNNLLEGDLLVTVNGMSCNHLSYDQVMAIADKTGSEFHLEVERKEKEAPPSHDSWPVHQSPSVKNTSLKITESKTMITEKNDSTILKDVDPPCISVSSISQLPPVITFTTLPNEIKTPKDKISKYTEETIVTEPEKTFQTSTETSSKVTLDEQKYEKFETEKFHEKHENKDTTITRTEYEKRVEKTDIIPSKITCDKAVAEDIAKIIEDLDTEYNKTASELYQVRESKKTEITTENLNGFIAPEITSQKLKTTNDLESIFSEVKNLSKELEKDSLLTSPFSTTMETLTEITDDSSSMTISKKKKMFSSSSFYEEPHAIYPTVEEQFEMAKKIAESLADDTNKKSKGANMFFKRAKRSTKWIHEGPEPSSESAPNTPEIHETVIAEVQSDISSCNKKFPKLKLVLDPRHPVDLASLRSTGHNISEHNVISPQVCHGLARDLESPVGKGSALFAKRKKKSSEWVVDEERVKALMEAHEKDLNQVKQNLSAVETPKTPYYRSPWDTASYLSPLQRVNPDRLAETVIAAADVKRRDSLQTNEDTRSDICMSPITPATPAASYYDIYKAKAPKGWSTSGTTVRSPPVSDTPLSYSPYVESFPAYSTLTSQPYAKKFNFQNFNTLPRKWKAQK